MTVHNDDDDDDNDDKNDNILERFTTAEKHHTNIYKIIYRIRRM